MIKHESRKEEPLLFGLFIILFLSGVLCFTWAAFKGGQLRMMTGVFGIAMSILLALHMSRGLKWWSEINKDMIRWGYGRDRNSFHILNKEDILFINLLHYERENILTFHMVNEDKIIARNANEHFGNYMKLQHNLQNLGYGTT